MQNLAMMRWQKRSAVFETSTAGIYLNCQLLKFFVLSNQPLDYIGIEL